MPRRPDRKANSSQQPIASSRRDDAQDTAIAAITPLGWGSTTLVAGTKAVALASVTAGSTVMLTPKSLAGTVGVLSYTLSAGVGFSITSVSVLDTSTVSWLVLP